MDRPASPSPHSCPVGALLSPSLSFSLPLSLSRPKTTTDDCRRDNLNVFFLETFLPVLSENSPSSSRRRWRQTGWQFNTRSPVCGVGASYSCRNSCCHSVGNFPGWANILSEFGNLYMHPFQKTFLASFGAGFRAKTILCTS